MYQQHIFVLPLCVNSNIIALSGNDWAHALTYNAYMEISSYQAGKSLENKGVKVDMHASKAKKSACYSLHVK